MNDAGAELTDTVMVAGVTDQDIRNSSILEAFCSLNKYLYNNRLSIPYSVDLSMKREYSEVLCPC